MMETQTNARTLLAEAEAACARGDRIAGIDRVRRIVAAGEPLGTDWVIPAMMAAELLDFDTAAKAAKRLCNEDGKDPRQWRLYAGLLQNIGRAAEASEILESIRRAAPDDDELAYEAGFAAKLAGDFDKARARYQGVIAKQPKHWLARTELAGIGKVARGDENLIELETERVRILEGGRAVGVATRSDGGASSELRGREIIVSSGALASPALLMRSGIGPAAHLSDCGIEVRQDLPGVGQNLMEHPSAGVMAFLKPQARQPYEAYYHIPIAIRYSSKVEGCPVGDMHMNIMTRASWHQIGRQFAPLFFWVNKSYSRGQLMLDPKAPAGPPRVDFRMLSDHRDVQRLADAFEYAMVLLADPVVTPIIEAIYPVELSERARGYTYPTRRNAIITDLLSRMLDIGAGVRKLALPKMMEGVPSAHRLAADRQELEAYLKEKVGGVWHPSGTCRMGAPGDRMAVTGKDGRVRGIAGLRVCDASIMPTIPCANTNVPVIMIAEKIAQDIRDTEGMAGQG